MTRGLLPRPTGRAMFDIKWIRDNPDAFDAGRRARGLEPLSAALLSLDDRRRSCTACERPIA